MEATFRTKGPFDLAQTLGSGQAFHWEAMEWNGNEGFAACPGDGSPVFVSQAGPEELLVRWEDPSADPLPDLSRYLGAGHDLARIHATFPGGDPFLEESIAFCPGLRLLRQPLWECLATFLTSSLKQVAHIRAISLELRRRYGEAHRLNGREFHAYPRPGALAQLSESELRDCALGYRAKSLLLAARAVDSGEADLAALESAADFEEAAGGLLQLHGVGEKIAHCVLLFGCGRWEAFPIDVWIERVLRRAYRKRVKGPKLQRWAMDHFGPCAGYAQQYLFHRARTEKIWDVPGTTARDPS